MKIFNRGKKDIQPEPLTCSFCGKSENEVRRLIAGPKVYICEECVELCNDILADEQYGGRKEKRKDITSLSTTGIACALCNFPIAPEEAVMVPDRGPLCSTCMSAVKAVIEQENDADKKNKS
jgi:hypothetical protein